MHIGLNTKIDVSFLQNEGFKHCDGGYYIKIKGYPIINLSESCRDEYEVVIKGYQLGIENIYSMLDGSFTVIIYDDCCKRITILTDPYGLESIYYFFSTNKDFLFSYDLENLLVQCPSREIDMNGLAEFLRFLDISAPRTIFKNVHRLESGSILVYSILDKELAITHIQRENTVPSHLSNKDYLYEFERLLFESMEERISSFDRIGIMLSGGIDSSLLAVILNKLRIKKSLNLSAYTVGFDDIHMDESKVARRIADYLGITHYVLRFQRADEMAMFYEFIYHLENPFADPAVIPTMLALRRVVDDGIEEVIEGTGADGTIGYMPSNYHRLVFNYTSKVPYPVRKLLTFCLKTVKDPLDITPLFDFKDPQEKFIRWKGWTGAEIEQLCGIRTTFEDTTFYKTYNKYKKSGVYELYRQLMMSMPDDRIFESLKYYKMKPILPFFHKPLREYIESLPFSLKYQNGTEKVLYKELLGKYIPKELWDVPKHGFDYPFEKLLRHDDFRLLRTYLSKDVIGECGFFDFSVVEGYLQRFMNGDDAVKFKIWALVIFLAWYYEHP